MKKGKYNKIISLFLSLLLVVSLLSSCGLFKNSSKDTEKIEETTENSEIVESTEKESTELVVEEEISTEEERTSEQETASENETASEQESFSVVENTTNVESNKENVSTENTTPKPEVVQPQAPAGATPPPDFTPEISTEEENNAKAIVNQIIKPGMSDFEKAITIHDWLLFNVDYDHSYSIYDVEGTLNQRVAVCQGYALTFEAMAEAAGLEAVFIGGTADNGSGAGYQSHAWNRVKINGVWYNVDVTWDDPGQPGKNPSDHSGNGYDYFLISDAQLNKNHNADYFPEESGSCPQDYDRLTILKFAANSGKYGDVAVVTNFDEANTGIKKFMDMNKSSVTLWIYDTSINVANSSEYMTNLRDSVQYMINVGLFYPSDKGIIKATIGITPSSEWDAIPVVRNVDEFKALLDKNGDAGIRTYTVRYESANGEPVIAASKYGFSVSYVPYNSGNSWLIMVNIK